MTFRARPSSNRPRTWDDRNRRSFLVNTAFIVIIVIAVVLLALAFGVSWYNQHLSEAATVNGQTITKDAFNKQLAINAFQVDYQRRQIRTQLSAGHLRTTDATARLSVLDQRVQQASSIALEQLIDGKVMDQLAAAQNVTVTDADVDTQLTNEATTPETRHAWEIVVAPVLAAGETTATDAEKAAAKAKADQALADLTAGKDWETVAKAVSIDPTKDQGGDVGFIDKNASLDPAFVAALMAAQKDTPTAAIEGADGSYRIGRVTEIVAPVVDATLADQVKNEGISLDDFRAALRRSAVQSKLNDAILAPFLASGPQRDVQEIYLQADIDPSTGSPTGKESTAGAIKIRHILYSPNGDPQAAASLAPDDAAWKAAEAKANATYQKLQANPDQFASIAKSESDDSGSAPNGGIYWFTKDDGLLPEFANAIFKEGLVPGQLLAPVKTSAGWHVIQILHYAPDTDWAAKLKQQAEGGADFAQLARENSDGTTAAAGGGLGFIGKGQLTQALTDAIFATKVGAVSDPVTVDGDGTYLFKVNKEEVREPDAAQQATIKSSAFADWYAAQKAKFTITRDPGVLGATS